jgi:hypothetical protein
MLKPRSRIVSVVLLVAAGAVVTLVVGQILFPENVKPIIAGWVALSIMVLTVAFLSWYLEPKRETTPRKDVISIFVSIASSLILIGSLGLAWLSLDSTQQQTKKNLELSVTALESARAEQRSRRFMEALEKLGGETPHKRLAGVYAFQKLDEDFENTDEWNKVVLKATSEDEKEKLNKKRLGDLKEHWSIMEIMTHFIQEVSPVPKKGEKLLPPNVRVEVYEIMKYLGARKLSNDLEPNGLNFQFVDLRRYPLQEISNVDATCRREPACERDPECPKPPICEKLPHCRPKFDGAQFIGANLAGANLECFSFKDAKFDGAILTGAIFRQADLTDAVFANAHLEGADLSGAVLNKANQLEFAFADEKTKCPTGFAFDTDSGACLKRP